MGEALVAPHGHEGPQLNVYVCGAPESPYGQCLGKGTVHPKRDQMVWDHHPQQVGSVPTPAHGSLP